MPQLHLYVTEAVAESVRVRAGAEGMPVSRWLAGIVTDAVREDDAWPRGYLEDIEPSPDFRVPDDIPLEPLAPLDRARA
ncbi:MAG: hypothetical protein ACO3KD_01340 [Gaiellales bacterium]|jgi:hypothetical protein